jgi:hypothetical protein
MPDTVRLHRVLATKPDKVYAPSSRQTQWRSGCRPTALPAPFTTSTRKSAAAFACHSAISPLQEPFVRRTISGARARRAPAVHGQIRRSQSARRNPGDGDAQASVLRHRTEYRAGRSSRRHSGGSVLSRLAGFVAKSTESRRARNQSIDVAPRKGAHAERRKYRKILARHAIMVRWNRVRQNAVRIRRNGRG